jgi:hypothetical protein
LIRRSHESFLNENKESHPQFEKHNEQRNSTVRGIVTDLINSFSKAYPPMDAICKQAARNGKLANAGSMTTFSMPIQLLSQILPTPKFWPLQQTSWSVIEKN